MGRVGLRVALGITALRRSSASLLLAARRFWYWERCSLALTVKTVPVRRPERLRRARERWMSFNAVVVATSKLSCTRESVVFTPCPPGPEACVKRSTSSLSGTTSPFGAPGPGSIRKSCTPPVCLNYRMRGTLVRPRPVEEGSTGVLIRATRAAPGGRWFRQRTCSPHLPFPQIAWRCPSPKLDLNRTRGVPNWNRLGRSAQRVALGP